MPNLGYYERGTWDAQCDECGLGFKFNRLQLRWDHAWVCGSCFEPRQPQDFVRAVRDDPSVPVSRPRLGLPTNAGLWVNNISWYISWTNNVGNVIPWSAA